jgi:hypothetical protein
MPASKDLTGQRFGRLQVLQRGPNIRRGHTSWLCRCDCGTERYATTGSLVHGRTRSCGCWNRGVAARSAARLSHRHGYAVHGKPPEYWTWVSIKRDRG